MTLAVNPHERPGGTHVGRHVYQRAVSGDAELRGPAEERHHLWQYGCRRAEHFEARDIEGHREERACGGVHEVAAWRVVGLAAASYKHFPDARLQVEHRHR